MQIWCKNSQGLCKSLFAIEMIDGKNKEEKKNNNNKLTQNLSKNTF